MKKIIFFQFKSFLTIFAFVLCSFAVFAQEPCPEDKPGCFPAFPVTSVVSVPDFPNCFLTVEYQYQNCFGEFRIFDVKIQNFDFLQCEDWINFIVGLYFNEGEVAFQAYFRKFNEAIGSQLLLENAQNVANQQDPTPFYCGKGNNTIAGSFYPGGCVSTWIGSAPKKGPIFRQIACSTDLCCGTKKVYCVDPVTNQPVLLSEEKTETGGTCISTTLKDCPQIDGVKWQIKSPCFTTCEGKGKKTLNNNDGTLISAPLQRMAKSIGGNYVSVKLFPNPSHDNLNLFFETKFSGTVNLLNMSGQVLQSVTVTDGNFTRLDVSNLVKGTYMLSFKDESSNVVTEKIIID